ncbi:MAG: 2-oxo acid dehydrogenase subunit E2 [Rhizobiales bacterium]|nr:2-oxo acid dehydrogenase subunit E2 [Hyphomicrobiales bacterium]
MDVIMPQLGETVAEGKVSTWFKQAGDAIEVGDNLFEIETDKVTMEVQALSSGVLSEIRVQSGETVPVGAVVAVIGETGAVAMTGTPDDAPGKVASPLASSNSLPSPPPQGGRERAAPFPSPLWGGVAPTFRENGRTAPFKIAPFAETNTPIGSYGKADGPLGLKVTPLARRLIAQNGIDLAGLAENVKARGAWRIGKADVEAALHQVRPSHPAPSPSRQGGGERAAPAAAQSLLAKPAAVEPRGQTLPFNTIRRQTGARLQESWLTVPHVFQATEVDFLAVDKARRSVKAALEARHGVALTYLPFIARAVCIAIADFPRVNARLEGDGLTLAPEINLGIAVDLAHNGLVVPVIRNADELNVAGLAKAITRQVEKARCGKLTPDDLAGGTYTISNNGSFGTLFTAPIVNPPQVAILSTDAVKKKPVVIESEGGDSIAIRPVGIVAQSFDHRAFDGAYSAAFLARLKAVLETRDWAGELA